MRDPSCPSVHCCHKCNASAPILILLPTNSDWIFTAFSGQTAPLSNLLSKPLSPVVKGRQCFWGSEKKVEANNIKSKAFESFSSHPLFIVLKLFAYFRMMVRMQKRVADCLHWRSFVSWRFFKSNNIIRPFVHFVPPLSVHVIRRCGAMLKSGLAVSC